MGYDRYNDIGYLSGSTAIYGIVEYGGHSGCVALR